MRAAWGLILLLLWAPASAQDLSAQVVFLGESHTDANDHAGQLQVLKQLQGLDDRPLVVLAEMFTERSRSKLELWPLVEIDSELWSREWGHPYELYQPILDWLKQEAVPLLPLRPDPAFTARVRQQGATVALERLDEILLGPKAYRDFMEEVASHHLPEGQKVAVEMLDRFFLVQCFWDEYMAWRVQETLKSRPESRIAVLVGHGHLKPGWGVPYRLRRRCPEVSSVTVGFSQARRGEADLLVVPEQVK